MRRTILLVSVLGLVLASCGGVWDGGRSDSSAPEASEGIGPPIFAEHGVSFEYPATWTRDPSLGLPEGTSWDVRFGPTEGLGYVHLFAYDVGVEPNQHQMEKFARFVFRFASDPPDKQQGDVVETSIAGVPALEARFARPGGPNRAAEHRALVFAHGTIAYGLDCFFLSADSDTIAGVDLVIGSFSF